MAAWCRCHVVGCRAYALSSLPPPLCSGVASPVLKRSGSTVTCLRVLPAPCALGTHGLAPCVRVCTGMLRPQYRLCAMRYAHGESNAHGARGETSLFPPWAPFSPVCYMEACGTRCGLEVTALAPAPAATGRLKCSVPLGIAKYFLRCRCIRSDSLPRPLRARHSRPRPVC